MCPSFVRILGWTLSILLATSAQTGPARGSDACDPATTLEPATAWRSSVDRGSASLDEPALFAWRLPSPGVATVDLLAGGPLAGRLAVHAAGCGAAAPEVSIVSRAADRLVLAVHSPGTLRLVAEADGRPYRLVTSFDPAASAPLRKSRPEVVDPDPDGFAATDDRLAAARKSRPEVVDPDPDGFAATDDHGDTVDRATPLSLGEIVLGELANGYGDDRDTFSFHLAEVSTVSVSVSVASSVLEAPALGGAEDRALDLVLTDADGRRLASRPIAQTVDDLERVATLAPGRYVVHVLGPGGGYALAVTPLTASAAGRSLGSPPGTAPRGAPAR